MDGDDQILGGTGSDRIFGGDGDDYIAGGDHKDFIAGQGGNDILIGNEGNDEYFFNFHLNEGRDFISDDLNSKGSAYGFGGGNDTLNLNVNYEDLFFRITGDGDLTITSFSEE